MQFFRTSKSISISELVEIEKELNVVFPNEFRAHFLKYNGGYPLNDMFKWNDNDYTRINSFLSIKHEGFGTLEEAYSDLAIIEDYLPKGIIPFATDDGGNFFCISGREHDHGCVYFLNNDHYKPKNETNGFDLLDKSFDHFIDNLVFVNSRT